jgi:hypothetical protein
MATATVNATEISAQWRISRKMYVVYSALVRAFAAGERCPELESPINRNEPEIIGKIMQWLDAVDEKIEVHQIRQLLQATDLSTEENIRLLLYRQLNNPNKTNRVRDKVDYLLVQYFAHCAPADSHQRKMSLQEVGSVLRPVFGDVDLTTAPYGNAIAEVLAELDSCESLADLLSSGILEKARALKASAAAEFFEPAVLVSFTRFNYLIRLGFFRLMHADLHAIRHALHQIEMRGQKTVDCISAGLSAAEPVADLRKICHEWKKPFRAAYSAGNNFRQLVEVRAAVEDAAQHSVGKG